MMLQPSPRRPLLWWGMNSTVSRKYPLAPHPELYGASSRALNAHESTDGKSSGYVGPIRSASFPTEVNNVVTRFVMLPLHTVASDLAKTVFGCLGATEHKTGLRQALNPKVPNHIPF